jgi:hypothetical protein
MRPIMPQSNVLWVLGVSMQLTDYTYFNLAERQNEKSHLEDFSSSNQASRSILPRKPWTLPAQGLAVFHGAVNAPRLSHYFLPRLLMSGKRVLFLDGANSADPRLIERLARERGAAFREFSRRMQIARAFTCFQLTELIARVPRFLAAFPAEVLMVTALPDLYFDEDVRDADARRALVRALEHLKRAQTAPAITVALFSSAETFAPLPARRTFFAMTCAASAEVWRFDAGEDGRPKLICERRMPVQWNEQPDAPLAKQGTGGDAWAARSRLSAM